MNHALKDISQMFWERKQTLRAPVSVGSTLPALVPLGFLAPWSSFFQEFPSVIQTCWSCPMRSHVLYSQRLAIVSYDGTMELLEPSHPSFYRWVQVSCARSHSDARAAVGLEPWLPDPWPSSHTRDPPSQLFGEPGTAMSSLSPPRIRRYQPNEVEVLNKEVQKYQWLGCLIDI